MFCVSALLKSFKRQEIRIDSRARSIDVYHAQVVDVFAPTVYNRVSVLGGLTTWRKQHTVMCRQGWRDVDKESRETSRDRKGRESGDMEDSGDWTIDAHGLYVATRSFLIRRGYCCANQCRNCPYINWCNSSTWRPLPAEKVQEMHVSLKAIEGARKALAYHKQQEPYANQTAATFHRAMITHYRLLLERWEPSSEKNQSGE